MALPMHAVIVETIARRAGIGIDDIEIQIEEEFGGSGLFGATHPDGSIIIPFPDAFTDEESLVRTLGHEIAAQTSEEDWWQFYREQEVSRIGFAALWSPHCHRGIRVAR